MYSPEDKQNEIIQNMEQEHAGMLNMLKRVQGRKRNTHADMKIGSDIDDLITRVRK